MNKNKALILLVLALVLILGGAAVLYDRLSQGAAPDQLATQGGMTSAQGDASSAQGGETSSDSAGQSEAEKVAAPDFTVYDREGNAVKLSDFAGKPIILNFWASWCGPCKSEMPDFNAAYLEIGEDVQFLMINATDGSRETVESGARYIEQQGFSFPVFYDTQSEACLIYGASALPTTFFIDKDGYVAAWAQGMISADVLQTGIDMIYAPEDT